MNTDYTTADMTSASNTSHTNISNKPEVKQLMIVSVLWILSIGTLGYLATKTEDMRIDLLLALVLMIGIPFMVCTYIAYRRERQRYEQHTN